MRGSTSYIFLFLSECMSGDVVTNLAKWTGYESDWNVWRRDGPDCKSVQIPVRKQGYILTLKQLREINENNWFFLSKLSNEMVFLKKL